MNRKKVLVTGAAGFIGYHVCMKLASLGHTVYGVDNFNDYYDPELKYMRAQELIKEQVTIETLDITTPLALKTLATSFQPTHIIHLAAQAGVRYSLENPRTYLASNIDGFLEVLETCRHIDTKLIFASSSSVYGHNKKTPYSIDDRTDNQASLYGVTKKSNELMAQTYHNLFKIKAIGLRFFTVFGPWGRPDMAYYKFTQSILNDEPIELYNHGNLARDFTYIDDIIEGIMRACDCQKSFEIYNLGGENPCKLIDFLHLIEELLGKKALVKSIEMQKGDVHTTYADMKKTVKDLGFQPQVSLRDGLEKFIRWYQKMEQSPSMEMV